MRSQPRIEYTAGLSFNGFCVLIVYHADVVVCCNDMQACVTMRNSNKKCELTPKVLQWHIGRTPSGAVFKHVNQHQFGCYHNIPFFFSVKLVNRSGWRRILGKNWLYGCWLVHGDDVFPAGRSTMWLVNRSPLRCIPSGNRRRLLESFALMMHFHRTFAAVGSFTVMMHSLRKVDYGRSFVHHSQRRLYGWSIVHRGDAFPAIDHVRLHGDLFTDGTIPRGNSFSGRILAKLTGSLILLSARQFFFSEESAPSFRKI